MHRRSHHHVREHTERVRQYIALTRAYLADLERRVNADRLDAAEHARLAAHGALQRLDSP
jgi:hypothetical protein